MPPEPDGDPTQLTAAITRLDQRLAQLESRLQTLESKAGLQSVPETPHENPAPSAAIPPLINPPAASESSAPHPRDLPPLVIPERYRPARSAAFVAARRTPAAAPSFDSLENKIGKQLLAWIGGFFFLAAVCFALKLAWDAGWFRPTPLTRVVIALAAGVLLIAAGQWLHSKKMRALAATLVATGLAVLMAALFAANVAFDPPVLSRPAAFIAVAVVGALGIALSLHMRIMPLTVLALLGMYLSPLILGSREDKSLQLLVYIAIVTAAGLAVSFFKRTWSAVRGVAFAAAWLWILAWAATLSRYHAIMGIIFCAGFFAMFLAEMIASLLRVMTPPADQTAPDRPPSPNTVLLESGAAVLSFANTALAMTAFAIVYAMAHLAGLWMIALGLAGIMGLCTFVTPSRVFSVSAVIQALGLVVLAAPLYFENSAVTYAWAILGLALAIYAFLADSRIARIWMFVMLLLVTLRYLAFDSFDRTLHIPLFHIDDIAITAWMIMGWGGALYALALGWFGRLRILTAPDGASATRGELWITAACIPVGALLLLAASIAGLPSGFPVTFAVALWTLAVVAFGYITVSEKHAAAVETVPVLLLVIISVKWIFHDGIALSILWQGDDPRTHLPLLNLFALNGILLSMAILKARTCQIRGLAASWIAALAFVAANVEMLRAIDCWMAGLANPWTLKNAAVSVLWGLIGLGAVLVGFRKKIPPVRWIALFLLACTVAKVLLVDMANVRTILRVLSFLVVGIVLLLVSFVYHKVGALLQESQANPTEPRA